MNYYSLPADAIPYRTLGPWTEETVPNGFQKLHSLKAGSWGRLQILQGQIDFYWDDGRENPAVSLVRGEEIIIPPLVAHHLTLSGNVQLDLTFYRVGDSK